MNKSGDRTWQTRTHVAVARIAQGVEVVTTQAGSIAWGLLRYASRCLTLADEIPNE